MAIWTWKQHDTWPPGFAVLKAPNQETGAIEPINLTEAVSVEVIGRVKGGEDPAAPLFKVKVKVVDAAGGRIEYVPLAEHTDTTQEISIEFEIDWGGGKKSSAPVVGYETMNVTDDLG